MSDNLYTDDITFTIHVHWKLYEIMIEVGQNDDFDLLTPDDLISIDFLFDI